VLADHEVRARDDWAVEGDVAFVVATDGDLFLGKLVVREVAPGERDREAEARALGLGRLRAKGGLADLGLEKGLLGLCRLGLCRLGLFLLGLFLLGMMSTKATVCIIYCQTKRNQISTAVATANALLLVLSVLCVHCIIS